MQKNVFRVFIDESGSFDAKASGRTQGFANQLAGLLIRQSCTDTAEREVEREAETVLLACHRDAGMALGDEVHGTEIWHKATYRDLIDGLLTQLERRHWQPIRYVSPESLRYRDKTETYTLLVGELIVRLFQRLALQNQGPITLHLVFAHVKTGETPGEGIEKSEYAQAINEAITRAAARRGVTPEALAWRVRTIRIGSGLHRRELQICDLISNASHKNYKKLSRALAERFDEQFGDYDFVQFDAQGRIRQLRDDGAIGLALRSAGEALWGGDKQISVAARRGIEREVSGLVAEMRLLSAPARRAELESLVAWLEQVIEVRRELQQGYQLHLWLDEVLVAALRDASGLDSTTLPWFELASARWGLTACNHLSDTESAQVLVERIDKLIPAVAGQWEHAPIMMESLLAQAVHHTDCFDYEAAAQKSQQVADYYGQLSELFADAMPGVFPDRVRSNLRGQALGTLMQSQMYAGLRDERWLKESRDTSNLVLDEFSNEADIRRSYQYRCQLECFAKHYDDARNDLARSLDIKETTWPEICATIANTNGIGQGFSLLHAIRLAAGQTIASGQDEFLDAMRGAGLLASHWCCDAKAAYPAHGIRRHLAVMHAAMGEIEKMHEALRSLRDLDALGKGLMPVALLDLAARLECAGIVWHLGDKIAYKILHRRGGIPASIRQLKSNHPSSYQRAESIFIEWEQLLALLSNLDQAPSGARDLLLRAGRLVGY